MTLGGDDPGGSGAHALRRQNLPAALRGPLLHPAGHHRLLPQPLHVLRHVPGQASSGSGTGEVLEDIREAAGYPGAHQESSWPTGTPSSWIRPAGSTDPGRPEGLLPGASPGFVLRHGQERSGEER